jgi:hypothetical protein
VPASPLLHYFLEEVDCAALAKAVVTCDKSAASPRRFLLEAYPLCIACGL